MVAEHVAIELRERMAIVKRQSRAEPNDRREPEARGSGAAWSDEELRHSVDVYVLLLRLQASGIDHGGEAAAQALLGGPLDRRNDAAIRYRMRNISDVARELGSTSLSYFSPAEQVGKSVRARIRAILLASEDFAALQSERLSAMDVDRTNALAALVQLREQISAIERGLIGIGHNGPPEPIEGISIDRETFADALLDIKTLEDGVEAEKPDVASVEASKARLAKFGISLAKWCGERTTKFADAALVALAPAIVMKVMGLVPVIVNALELVTRALAL